MLTQMLNIFCLPAAAENSTVGVVCVYLQYNRNVSLCPGLQKQSADKVVWKYWGDVAIRNSVKDRFAFLHNTSVTAAFHMLEISFSLS